MREKGGKKLNILVCDDDKEIVEAIEIYLQQEGYQVFRAYDGEDALKILKEEDCDSTSSVKRWLISSTTRLMALVSSSFSYKSRR